MVSRHPRPRRLLLPIALAAVLAAEITGLAIARSILPAGAPSTGSHAAATAPLASSATALRLVAAALTATGQAAADSVGATTTTQTAARWTRSRVSGPGVSPVSPVHATKARTAPASTGSTRAKAPALAPSYRGRNHVWIPSLGINKTVQSFPCSRSRPPDAGVYRWGCAGRNNIYLLSHAWSTFKPLHDAYVRGGLHKGMRVVYADGSGRVHTYAVVWWRVVAPTTAASWAWAPLSRPSMTLQTCVGSNSQYRLMVRLVRVG
jgi:hypothetical protein